VHTKDEILEVLRNRKLVLRIIAAGIMITINWSIYIWAVNSDHIIQTSIGYYIEPLVVCLFGVFLFREKLNKYKIIALVMGFIGVVAVVAYFKEMPTIALGVAVSFSIYTAMKKGLKLPPIMSLLFETVFLAPFALIVIIYIESKGIGGLAAGGFKYFLLMFCGLFTAFPLVLFANAANKISMFVLGLSEYISPTIALFLSIFYFKEDFAPVQLIAFVIIWIGLVFFTVGEYKEYQNDSIE
jgi:chloramphenicol-sensitive protein RarD